MADSEETTTSRQGLGAQLWGAVKDALIDEDPIAAARRAKLQGGKAPADKPAEPLPEVSATMSPMAATLMAQVLSKATAYTALTEKLAPLETIVLDERTRYQAAYALIKSSRSVDQVVQAIAMQHLPALEAEAASFGAQALRSVRSSARTCGDGAGRRAGGAAPGSTRRASAAAAARRRDPTGSSAVTTG